MIELFRRGQGFKVRATPPYPNLGGVPPTPRGFGPRMVLRKFNPRPGQE